MTQARVQGAGMVERYAAFVAVAIVLALLAQAALLAGGSLDLFLWALGQVFVPGLVLGGLAAAVAMVPGWWVFRGLRRAIRGGWPVNMIGTGLASVAVACLGALAATLALGALLGPLVEHRDLPAALALLVAIGAPAAILAGILIFGREDLARG